METIGEFAFYNCTDLSSVTIGNSVETIGESAFYNCTDLSSVTIGNSVKSIGAWAFGSCSSLTSITIPNSVVTIGEDAFSGCADLSSITIGNSVTEIGWYAFQNCSNLTSVVFNAKNCESCECPFPYIKTLTIGEEVETIPSFAFEGCTGLTSIEIPNSVKTIGDLAFNFCTGLTSIEIPNSVETIGDYAFQWCTDLSSVTIGNSVTSIGDGVFSACDNLEKMTVEAGNPVYDSRNNCNAIIETATNTLVAGCQNTIIPNSVTTIGNNGFNECSGLTSIEIPNSVETIGSEAFEDCTGLTSIEIPNSVSSIGDGAFDGCSSLISVTVNIETPLSIDSNTFTNRANATLYVPAGSGSAYKVASYWKEFKEIIEIGGAIETINTLSATISSIHTGETEILSIGLDNEDTMIAFEFDLQLPDGVTISKDEDGDFVATLGSRASKHSLAVSDKGNGTYHVLCYSNTNRAISGNEGELLNVELLCDENVEAGNYEATLRNIIFSDTDKNKINLDDYTFGIEVIDAVPGDANGDGDINVMDVVEMVAYIMGEGSDNFIFTAADLDKDGSINVMDLVNLVSLIMSSALQAPAQQWTDNSMLLQTQADGLISVSVDSKKTYVASEFLVEVSAGQRLENVTTDNRHHVMFTPVDDARYKVMTYSSDNSSFDNGDALVQLHVSGEGIVTLTEALLVDENHKGELFAPTAGGYTTGIDPVLLSSQKEEWVYDMLGRKVPAYKLHNQGSKDVPAGVYIVNRKKQMIK